MRAGRGGTVEHRGGLRRGQTFVGRRTGSCDAEGPSGAHRRSVLPGHDAPGRIFAPPPDPIDAVLVMDDQRLVSAYVEGDAAVAGERGGGFGDPVAVIGQLAVGEHGVRQDPLGGLPRQDPHHLAEDIASSPLGRLLGRFRWWSRSAIASTPSADPYPADDQSVVSDGRASISEAIGIVFPSSR